MLKANEAELKLKDTQAKIGKTLAPVNNAFTEMKNKVLQALTPIIEALAKKFLQLYEYLKEHPTLFKILATVVTGVAVAFGVLATALAIQAIIQGVTKAMTALNLTMSLNPFLAVATAIIAVVTALVALTDGEAKFDKETKKLIKTTNELNEKVKEQTDAYARLKETRAQAVQETESEYQYYRTLSDELSNITDENGRVIEGYEDRAQVITGILSNALGEEITTDQLVADGKQKIIDNINKLIEAKKAEALLASYEESYTEAIKNQNSVYQQISKSKENESKLLKEILETKKEMAEIEDGLATASTVGGLMDLAEYSDLEESLEELTKSYDEATKATKNLEEQYLDYQNVIINYEGASSAIISGDADKINEALVLLNNNFIQAENGTRTSLEKQVKNAETMLANMKTALANGEPGVTQQMVDNAEILVSKAKAELDKAPPETKESGKNFVQGFANGIASKTSTVTDAVKAIGKVSLNMLKSVIGEASPAKKPMASGKNYGLGFAIGIRTASRQVNKSVIDMAKSANKSLIDNLDLAGLKNNISTSIKELTTDTRTEVQKVTDDLNKDLLESEKKYNAESERLKDSRNESDKKYLENLKKTADTERKIHDARLKDFENLKKKMLEGLKSLSDETINEIQELEKLQDNFSKKLKDYGELYNTITVKISDHEDFQVVELADLEKQTQSLQNYYDLLMSVKARGGVPDDFFTILQDMSVEDGTKFATALLKADDEAFKKYLTDWQTKQETADELSKLMYEDKVDDLIDVTQEKFEDMTYSFALVGESAGEQFSNGFLPEVYSAIDTVIGEISRAFSSGISFNTQSIITTTADSVPKMARGGILKKGQVGFLEGDGAEAVVPLEQNTGWINSIADRLNNRMSNNPTESDGALLSKLDKIYERLDRLQVVLDSGALVGGIIAGVDSKLNEREMLAMRGV